MKQDNYFIGKKYEKIAGEFLKSKNCQILEYNFSCKFGEVDIIAKDGEYLVFCEVKYRKNIKTGYPLEAVGIQKQTILSKCAMYYLTIHGLLYMSVRFDVIGILADDIEWIQNAFEYKG